MPACLKLYTARIACFTLFFLLGINIGVWVAQMPGMKTGFQLNAGQLGLAIMASGLASLLMALPAGRVVDVLGCRAVSFSSGVFGPLAYMTLPSLAKLGVRPYAALFLFNVFSAGGFVSCNTRACELEILWGSPIMSSFHAAFSAGGLVGSAAYSALLTSGLSWETAFPMVCVGTAIAALITTFFMDEGLRDLRLHVHPQETIVPPCAWTPNLLIVTLGIVAAFAQLTEGAVGDWTAIYLQEYDQCPYHLAPLGYSSFSAAMGIFRLVGDKLCQDFGRRRVYQSGALLIACGITVFLLTKSPALGVMACAVIGSGCANILPIIVSVAGKHSKPSPSVSIATVSSLGNAGLLAGPAIIGFVAQTTSLRVGLSILILGALCLNLASFMIDDETSVSQSSTSPRQSVYIDDPMNLGEEAMIQAYDYRAFRL